MKFSLEWLRWFLDTDASVAGIAAALNRIGHEVEGIEDPAEKLKGFKVARVLTAARHPDADKLQVLTVDAGDGAQLQVVCGAPNARSGMVGVLGLPGAVVPANGMELRRSAIRGVTSNGMMCSVHELQLGDDHEGIIELPADAPVGADFAAYQGSSPVFDLAITPNRPDCMGVYGIARDLAAAGMGTLKALSPSGERVGRGGQHERRADSPSPSPSPEGEGDFVCPIEIRTDDPEGCPAFYGRVIRGVTNGASPPWMQRRLIAAGQRPISALVDITNYVMLAFGRPAHVYDLARLTGPVVARRARGGEQVLALNGKTYALDDSMTVIADDAGVHDIAGIMGGAHSGVTDATTEVLLEIAYFDPTRIGLTGRKLSLASDARTRFERGVDPAFLDAGLAILTDLILRICGGSASEVARAGRPPLEPKTVAFDPGLTARLGGVTVREAEQRRILEALDFSISPLPFRGGAGGGACAETVRQRHNPHPNPSPEGEGLWRVTCPPRRHDIEGPADLVEEVVRIHGLDKVGSMALPRREGVALPTATGLQQLERRLRRTAAARGLNEAVTWSFLPGSDADHFRAGEPLWVLENPISEDMKVMRPSLLPGLLAAARRNADRGASASRLFEIGRRYFRPGHGASDERPTLGVVLAGEKTPRGWAAGKAKAFDAYDAKAEALALLEAAGAPVANLQVMGEAGPQFHPGQSATLRLGPKAVLARFGALHPATLKAFDIDGPVMAVELFLDAIPAKKAAGFARPAFAPPALQPITRDFAFLVPAELAAGDLVRAVRGADKQAIVSAQVFDVFTGPGVPEGRKSVAIEVTLQPGDRSFTDGEIKAISDKIVATAAKQGAELRG